jgi:hypothetical protein
VALDALDVLERDTRARLAAELELAEVEDDPAAATDAGGGYGRMLDVIGATRETITRTLGDY